MLAVDSARDETTLCGSVGGGAELWHVEEATYRHGQRDGEG